MAPADGAAISVDFGEGRGEENWPGLGGYAVFFLSQVVVGD